MGRPNSGKHTKRTLIAFSVNAVVTTAFALLIAFVPETVNTKLALMSANIIFVVAVMQFTISASFGKISDDAANSNMKLDGKLDEIERKIKLDETVRKALAEEEHFRQFILPMFQTAYSQIELFLSDKRTGALEMKVYYDELLKLAEKAKNNKEVAEIWALSSLLGGEYDTEDPFEKTWLAKMQELDKLKIKTRRLFLVRAEDAELLKCTEVNGSIEIQLKKLLRYCAKNTQYKNTKSYAFLYSRVNLEDIEKLIGPGFFAVTFSDTGESTMIRDVSLDDVHSNALGGEVDFNTERIRNAKNAWNGYINFSDSLIEYLQKNSSLEVRKKMISMGFDGITI